jgi:hypothetical protein
MHFVKYISRNTAQKARSLALVISAVFAAGALQTTFAATTLPELPLLDSVSKDGITWRFAQKTPVGRFVNGDYYVVGNTTIASVSPAPTAERNGSVLNLPADPEASGFDGRVSSDRFKAGLRATYPLAMKPGDALISSISLASVGSIEPWLREGAGESTASPVKTVSVLTCLASPVHPTAFRPSYCDRQQRLFDSEKLRRSMLPNLQKVSGVPDLKVWASHFRRPWLDVCFYAFDAAAEYQAMYGREVSRSVGIGTLLLCCNFTAAEKESLLVNMVQYGIDLYGARRTSGMAGPWRPRVRAKVADNVRRAHARGHGDGFADEDLSVAPVRRGFADRVRRMLDRRESDLRRSSGSPRRKTGQFHAGLGTLRNQTAEPMVG